MSIRRPVLIQAGGFHQGFGWNHDAARAGARLSWLQPQVGDEETEFCIRVSRRLPHGIWLHAPDAVVQHRVAASRGRVAYFLRRSFDEGWGKAGLVALHGAHDGLASERHYATRTLPLGVARGIAGLFRHRDLGGLGRALAIVAGFTSTTAGYALGRFLTSALRTGAKGRNELLYEDTSVSSY
jgi:hypothetical protein